MAGKQIIIYVLAIIILMTAYLALAHFFIFQRIGAAKLITPIRQDSYVLNSGSEKNQAITYVALGDSLTAGVGADKYEESYPYLVAKVIADKRSENINLKGLAYPGAKTSDLINDLLIPAITVKPDLVTLLIGINDVYGNISAAVFKKNYQNILERLAKDTSAKIYLIGLPYIGSPKALLFPYNYYYFARIREFNRIIKGLALKYNFKYIDLATPELIELGNNLKYYSRDLFHPSVFGYKIWAQKIYDDINQ
jgi:acyl-CoA thioesterase I